MELGEQTPLNKQIQKVSKPGTICPDLSKDDRWRFYIDTFRHPYIRFQDSFPFPGINTISIELEQAKSIIDLIIERAPFMIEGLSVLPEPRPRKNSHQLQFVRKIEVPEADVQLLFMLRVAAEYFGGASRDEVVGDRAQQKSPAVLTDRIYYQTRLFPVKEVQTDKHGGILDFEPYQIKDAIFKISSNEIERDMWSSILFDEVDFSSMNAHLTDMYQFYGAEWTPGRLFQPFSIDYLTLCMMPLKPCSEALDKMAAPFARLFRNFESNRDPDELSESDKAFWAEYYSNWEYERVLSRSGNPHWEFRAVAI